ncbi:MAG: nickel-dependent hydrogenase large subunit [Sulfuricellaceae bacterium]
MTHSGKLSLRIVWDGNIVLGVDLKSTRPQAYRLLEGRSPDNAVQMAPLLFSVCGKAQQAAAMAAVSAAQGGELPGERALERSVACEAMQESLWRLLLDWPGLLGLPQEQRQFVHWHGALNAIAAGQGNAEIFLAELLQVLLGVTVAEWKQLDSYAKLSAWRNAGQGLFAPVFAALECEEERLEFVGEPTYCALQPNWRATDIWQTYAGHFDHEFAAMPLYGGKPMETGALAHSQYTPLLQDILRKRPSRLSARVIARLIDLLDSAEALAHENIMPCAGEIVRLDCPQQAHCRVANCLCENDHTAQFAPCIASRWEQSNPDNFPRARHDGRIQHICASDATGLSVVRTARGMLLHHVRIEAGRVAQYLTVAPTEWNFHPQGALASDLGGLKESDAVRLTNTVKHYVLSLDPCVEYEIEIAHA